MSENQTERELVLTPRSEFAGKNPVKTVMLKSWVPFAAYNILILLGLYIFRKYWYVVVLLAAVLDIPFFLVRNRISFEIYPDFIAVYPDTEQPDMAKVIRNEDLVSYEVMDSDVPAIKFVYHEGIDLFVKVDISDAAAAYRVLFTTYPEKSRQKMKDDEIREYMAEKSKGGFSTIADRIRTLITKKIK